MALQKTLAIIKPDGVMLGADIVERIRGFYRAAGLTIVREQTHYLKERQVRQLYREHTDKPYFPGLVISMTNWPCVSLVIDGENAVEVVRRVNGDRERANADPGTIRREIESAGGPFNVVHASDSPAAVDREMGILFRGTT